MMFCFKQKTAYDVRISDWSSDVCSSDLVLGALHDAGADPGARHHQPAGTDIDDQGVEHLQPAGPVFPGDLVERPRRLDLEIVLHRLADQHVLGRSEARRVGTEWGSTCRSRGSPYSHKKTKRIHKN